MRSAAPVPGRWRLARTLAPTLEAVDAFCGEVRRRLKEKAAPADWYGVELLLREALTNAVLHGGGGSGYPVRCEVSVGARRVRMVVSDEGPGFDWKAQLASTTPEAATSGRGLRIYSHYADRVSFNEAGNRVVLERRLGQGGAGR
jgi:anti-sigma regulatory factor (Ser/Thr protein kinase)